MYDDSSSHLWCPALLQHGTNSPTPGRSCADRASRLIDGGDEIFRTERIKVLKTPVRTPVDSRPGPPQLRLMLASVAPLSPTVTSFLRMARYRRLRGRSRGLAGRLARRRRGRTEATVQSDVRMMLLASG